MEAATIACWFLRRNHVEGVDNEIEPITNLKLQKLLYYAQGAYSAITGEFLFDDDMHAWQHGPVVEEIYHKYKSNVGAPIIYDENDPCSQVDLASETQTILEQVYLEFGQFSAWKLRNMTHEEKPWKETAQNSVISKDKIRDSFIENYMLD